jgi:transcriptional regulator with XRE-family HTH domain
LRTTRGGDQELGMKIDEMTTNDELIIEQMTDPAFRAEWQRTALARAVALRLVRYRTEHDLSQRDLAKLLGMEQPQVARLERGDVNPTLETLMRLAGALEIEFTIDVRPTTRKARLVTKRAQDEALTRYTTDRAVAVVAAA